MEERKNAINRALGTFRRRNRPCRRDRCRRRSGLADTRRRGAGIAGHTGPGRHRRTALPLTADRLLPRAPVLARPLTAAVSALSAASAAGADRHCRQPDTGQPRGLAGFPFQATLGSARSSAAIKCARSSASSSPRGASTWRLEEKAGEREAVGKIGGRRCRGFVLRGTPATAASGRHRACRLRATPPAPTSAKHRSGRRRHRSPRIRSDRDRSRARPAGAIRSAPPRAPPTPDRRAGRGWLSNTA